MELGELLIPTPGEYDSVGKKIGWMIKKTEEKEAKKIFDERFGAGNWKMIEIDSSNPKFSKLVPFINSKGLKQQYPEILKNYEKYPNIAKLLKIN